MPESQLTEPLDHAAEKRGFKEERMGATHGDRASTDAAASSSSLQPGTLPEATWLPRVM